MVDNKAKIENLVRNMGELPTLPSVFLTINQMLSNPRTSATEVGQTIANDQVIASKVLKLVNSAFYGLPGRVNTISHAIVILGFSSIKNIVLTTSVLSSLNLKKPIEGFSHAEFWKHSAAVGALARLVAREAKFQKQEESFVAGLLHDIGKLILAVCAPDEFAKALNFAAEKKCLFLDAEQELFGLNHTNISAWVQEQWKLPADIASVLVNHHRNLAAAGGNAKLVAVVQVADVLARGLQIGHPCDSTIPILADEALDILGISEQGLSNILKLSSDELQNALALVSE
ncbi:HD family phosphohydrolase [Fibrobacterales bacterium]|nr:HD family phosphohydrolase [Fibrobacterales bacterium]